MWLRLWLRPQRRAVSRGRAWSDRWRERRQTANEAEEVAKSSHLWTDEETGSNYDSILQQLGNREGAGGQGPPHLKPQSLPRLQEKTVSKSTHPGPAPAGSHVTWAAWDPRLPWDTDIQGCHPEVTQGGSGQAEEIPTTPIVPWWPQATSPLTFYTCPYGDTHGEASSFTFSPEAPHFMGISSAM